MRTNEHTKIYGSGVILVPYRREHVEKYHEWMKSAELQELTGSEPLTLEEEYKMQQSWLEDNDKCTFIVLDKAHFEASGNEIGSMIGDTNLFFNTDDPKMSEAEIMIADANSRGKHRGWEAMLLMLRYGVEELLVKKYLVKIKCSNSKSIAMFKKMDFQEVSRSSIFQEVTLEREVSTEWCKWLSDQTDSYRKVSDEVR